MFQRISFALALFTTVSAWAQPESPQNLGALVEVIEENTEDLQGGVVAILYKGQIVYKRIFGHKQGDRGEITEDTLFPLASVSKPVSAMALALFVEKGSLRWDDKFKFPYVKSALSLKQMLSHTTGYDFPGNPLIEQGLSRAKILDKLKTEKPKCQPGSCYAYSNAMFSLVDDALRQKKLSLDGAIAAMRKALNTDGLQLAPHADKYDIAYPHLAEEGSIEALPYPPYYPKATPASAGVFASLNGMVEFFKLSFGYRPDLISEKARKTMQSPVILNNDLDKWGTDLPFARADLKFSYGIGWRMIEHKHYPGQPLIFHAGGIKGISTVIGFVPSSEVGFIMLLNQNSGVTVDTALRVWAACLGE